MGPFRMLRNVALTILAVVFTFATGRAQQPIQFARTPDISPDGQLVVFSYLGDIWAVEAMGGVARAVTMHEAHDIGPVFSPDGKKIAFSSNRHGSYDVFVVAVEGGRPRRLTFDSAMDRVTGWAPDGKSIVFESTRSVDFPSSVELYSVPLDGGKVRRLSACEGKDGQVSPNGSLMAYVRGPGTASRRGYRGAANDDIWICNADGSANRQLTAFDGHDASPMWAPDGASIYYVTESGSAAANIVVQDCEGKTSPRPITFHKDDGVRKARISGNGEWIVYECGADICVVSTSHGSARKLAIAVHADDKSNVERIVTFTRSASEFAMSPDEKHVAFVVHGQIFLTPVAGGKSTRLTESAGFDHGIAWAPDGQRIIFASDRNGFEDLYLLEPDDVDHPKLAEAQKFKTTRLTDTIEAEIGVNFAPDGKRVAFLRGGKLWTMNPDGSDTKPIANDGQIFDYDWSPDSKWLAVARMDGSFASELYIQPSDGASPAKNVTRYATYNGGVTWSATGHKIGFISQRRQNAGMFVLSLQKPAAGNASDKNSDIDWDDIHIRVKQAAPISAEEGAISNDGNKVAFRSVSNNGDDLWIASSDGSQIQRATTGNARPQQIQWSKKNTDVVYFRDGAGAIRLHRSGGYGEPSTIAFKAKLVIRRDEEFREMFEQSWRALRENFYDSAFHGVNWDDVRKKYRPLVNHVALKEDLYALVSLMLGELNASHLGIAGLVAAPEERTAELGLLFEENFPGPGVRISEILKRGPADRRGVDLKPGDIIYSIDNLPLDEKGCLERALNGKVGETIQLRVSSSPTADPKDPRAWRKVEIQAANRDTVENLMYERWVAANGKRVNDLSGGKLGYIHIPSMDEEGLDAFVRALYSDNFDKDAIVLDVRYNGGGFTHDQVLNYLGGKEHTLFRQRHGGEGLVLRHHDRKWHRPVVLLINNRSYSDAEILPSAFRTLGLGKLVGQPTGGHVIGTSSVRLIDGSVFRVPRTGVFTVKGVNMENEGVKPDYEVSAHPDHLAAGRDAQLDKAVEVLTQSVAEWRKDRERPGIALNPESKPGTTLSTPKSPPDPANK